MQRIFTEDILDRNGEVKFPQGMVRDFPRPTWEAIAHSAGKSLDQFTRVPKEALDAINALESSQVVRKRLKRSRKEAD